MPGNHLELDLTIGKEKEGLYFNLPFEVPQGVERMDIRYRYERYHSYTKDNVTQTEEINIVDLALASNTGDFIGSSGSDRSHIWISEYDTSAGYAPKEPVSGTWNVIVGAYKVQDGGVRVIYDIDFTFKKRILLKGDTHVHTTGSDGILSVDDITKYAIKNNLDYLFITDHNNYAHNDALSSSKDLTVIPGTEWTHFNGHANMLGVKRPFLGTYYANNIKEVQERLANARNNNALVSINHPFDKSCPWKWGFDKVEYDLIEIWNGIMKQSDMECVAWWQDILAKGRRLPIIGGSDFHSFNNFSLPGAPATCIYSMSRGQSDILRAIKQGNSFVSYQVDGPEADIQCNGAYMGDILPYEDNLEVIFTFNKVKQGDLIIIYSADGVEKKVNVEASGNLTILIKAENKRFYRAELYRELLPGGKPLLCLITNPLYFE